MRARGLALGLALFFAGCTRGGPTDEQRLRSDFGIPPELALQALEASPRTSTDLFGREGLAMRASFTVPPGQLAAVKARLAKDGWRPLPTGKGWLAVEKLQHTVDDALKQASGAAPSDEPAHGLYRCTATAAGGPGGHARAVGCEEPSPRLESYRLAWLDLDRARITVFSKNFY